MLVEVTLVRANERIFETGLWYQHKGMNKMVRCWASIVCCAVLLFGCASVPPPLFTEMATDQSTSPPPPDKAQIIFLQPFKPLGGHHLTGIYEVKGTERVLLGALSSQTKMVQLVEPGQHMYMVNGFGAGFLRAKVEAGKRYYVLSRFIAYVGYQLRPIRRTGPSDYNATIPVFRDWMTLPSVAVTSSGAAWFIEHQAALDKNYTNAWEAWLQRSDSQRAELTLNPEDAIPY